MGPSLCPEEPPRGGRLVTLDELKAVARTAVEGVGNDLIATSRYLHANPEVSR